jgi:glycosyltransferase involved in cell wall biosynthesis
MKNLIFLCVFNEEKYLLESLESLANQTYSNFRAILLDNCSTDNSYLIAQKFSEHDSRFEYHKSPTNQGNLRNFLWGLEICNEPFFMWLGGHDIISKNYLYELIKNIKMQANLSFAYSSHNFISEAGVINRSYTENAKFSPSKNAQDRFLNSIGALVVDSSPLHAVFRKEAIEGISRYIIHSSFSWDHAILSFACFFGNPVFVNNALYTRRTFVERDTTNLSRTKGDIKKLPNRSMVNLIVIYCLVWLQKTDFSFWGFAKIPMLVIRVRKKFSIKLFRNLANYALTVLRNYRNSLASRSF